MWSHILATFCFSPSFVRRNPAMVRTIRGAKRGCAGADGALEATYGAQHLLLVPRCRSHKRPLRRIGAGLGGHRPSTVACDFFFLPPDHVPFGGPEEVLRLAIFLLTG